MGPRRRVTEIGVTMGGKDKGKKDKGKKDKGKKDKGKKDKHGSSHYPQACGGQMGYNMGGYNNSQQGYGHGQQVPGSHHNTQQALDQDIARIRQQFGASDQAENEIARAAF